MSWGRINRHRQALDVGPGRVFALKTVGGGVLAFYALTAQLTLAPPPGQTFQVGISGFYSSSQTLTSATVEYAEQFATYIPPDREPADPRLRVRHHRTRVDDRWRVTGQQFPQLARGRARIRRRLTRRMRG